MTSQSKINIDRILLFLLIPVIIIETIMLLSHKEQITEKEVKLQLDFDKLERSYARAMKELEGVSNRKYDDVAQMRNTINTTISQLKQELAALGFDPNQLISSNIAVPDINDPLDSAATKSQNLNIDSLIADVPDTADATVSVQKAEEIDVTDAGVVVYGEEITKEELARRYVETQQTLSKIRSFYQEEKSKNEKLRVALTVTKEQIQKLETDGKTKVEEIVKMKEKQKQFEQQLAASTEVIEQQNTHLNILAMTSKKANVDCYFIFEQGNAAEEAVIYLTDKGLSSRYLSYFTRKKPEVHIEFRHNADLYEEGVEKVTLKVFNSAGMEIYKTPKTIGTGLLEEIVSGKIFGEGIYSIELKSGEENLIIGGNFVFKIGN